MGDHRAIGAQGDQIRFVTRLARRPRTEGGVRCDGWKLQLMAVRSFHGGPSLTGDWRPVVERWPLFSRSIMVILKSGKAKSCHNEYLVVVQPWQRGCPP